MFEVCLSRLAVPPSFNAYKNNPNHSVWMYLIPVLLAQRCAFAKISPLLTYTRHKSASDHNEHFPFSLDYFPNTTQAFPPFPSVALAALSLFYSAVWQTTATRRFSANGPRSSFHISGGDTALLLCVREREKNKER